MTQYDNRGSLWPNKNREKPTHPHFKGEATINGITYWVNCWFNTEVEGRRPPLTMSFRPKEDQGDQIQGRESEDAMDAMKQLTGLKDVSGPEQSERYSLDDDIPF